MLGVLLGRRLRPFRVVAVCVPAGIAFYVLACGDASNTDAQNYFSDAPVPGTTVLTDAGIETIVLPDGAVVEPIQDVYVPPVYGDGNTGIHDGTLVLTSTMTSGANVDLFSNVTIPLVITSQLGFNGNASLLALGTPGSVAIAFQPDDPMVTPDTPGTCNMTITTKSGQAPGTISFKILAFGGSGSIDAGTPVAFTVTVNPKLTIEIPTAFEANPTENLPQYQIGYAPSIATNPIQVIFQNDDTADYFEVGANGAFAGFPDGQKAIAPGGTEPPFSSGYTDAGTARVIDQKANISYYAKGYGATEAIAESGGGTDGGNPMPYKGSIQVQ